MGAYINAAINVKGNTSFVHNVATQSGGEHPLNMRCFIDVFGRHRQLLSVRLSKMSIRIFRVHRFDMVSALDRLFAR